MDKYSLNNDLLFEAWAFETMLNENGSEITHKISVRTARFLEKDLDKRVFLKTILKKIYSIRSELVHQGIPPSASKKYNITGSEFSSEDLLKKGYKIC